MSKVFLNNLDLNKNELQNAVIQNLATAPSNPLPGQQYYNTTDNVLYFYNGVEWVKGGKEYTGISPILVSAANAISISNATNTGIGAIRIATDTEFNAASSEVLAVNPKQTKTAINTIQANLTSHINNTNNPHSVSKAQLLLENVDNTSDLNKPISTATQSALDLKADSTTVDSHISNKNNPHSVDKTQIGLNNVTNDAQVKRTEMGAVNGVATLDSGGKVPLSQINDSIIGQLLYGGNVNASTAGAELSVNGKTKLGTSSDVITLTNNTTAITGYTANEGIYYIVATAGTFAEISFLVGDWLLSNGSTWTKIDNTDAVTGVKGNSESSYRIGNVNITKENIGLGNVENTADLDKPISILTQQALNLKAPLVSPNLTGIPTTPTVAIGTANTTIASTAFVQNAIDNIPNEKYIGSITGDGSTTSFNITHNLNTYNLTITVYDSVTKDDVIVDTTRTNLNTVQINFSIAFNSSQTYIVVILAGAYGTSGTTNHAQLTNLDYTSSGHTGFVPSTAFDLQGSTLTITL